MMEEQLENALVVAISSRALFDLTASHQIFEEQGVDAYSRYQMEHENDPLKPGTAFALVQKLLGLNQISGRGQLVEVVLTSRNSADTGLRVFNSIEHHSLSITRAVFTGGESPWRYLGPLGAALFLSVDSRDVRSALEMGIAAATILPSNDRGSGNKRLKIAFDGDAVLFSDDAERIYRHSGLHSFQETEKNAANEPLPGGPFKPVLRALYRIQDAYGPDESPIRTALITSRSAPAHERVIRTLRAWKIRIDESFFLGGMSKGEFLNTFGADIFFDDRREHCDSARGFVPTAHVPHGVSNG